MLANHTSVRHLFNRCLSQYDKLSKRKAFLENYKVGARKPEIHSFLEPPDCLHPVCALAAHSRADGA
jgi:hypothetical protein